MYYVSLSSCLISWRRRWRRWRWSSRGQRDDSRKSCWAAAARHGTLSQSTCASRFSASSSAPSETHWGSAQHSCPDKKPDPLFHQPGPTPSASSGMTSHEAFRCCWEILYQLRISHDAFGAGCWNNFFSFLLFLFSLMSRTSQRTKMDPNTSSPSAGSTRSETVWDPRVLLAQLAHIRISLQMSTKGCLFTKLILDSCKHVFLWEPGTFQCFCLCVKMQMRFCHNTFQLCHIWSSVFVKYGVSAAA